MGNMFCQCQRVLKLLCSALSASVPRKSPIAGKSSINVTLEQDVFKVDEVVVVAYGTQQKRDITGTVASVKGDAIKMSCTEF